MLRRLQCLTLMVCIVLPVNAARAHTAKQSARRSADAISTRHANSRRTRNTTAKQSKRGQQVIHPARVREIQAALIGEAYLNGPANGVWDRRSKNAMARFQSNNGWQSKVVPDSRALIKLGLGPDHTALINPETAAIGFIPGGGTRTLPSTSQH